MQDVDEKELIENTDGKCKPKEQVLLSQFFNTRRRRRVNHVAPPKCWVWPEEGPIWHDCHAWRDFESLNYL